MDLLEQIKSDRAQKKKKERLRPTLFHRISGVVKRYGLGESFIRELENPEDFILEENMEFAGVRKKQLFEIPLFSLAEEKEYRLTMAIIKKVNNRYLDFVYSPEEIAISKPLFDLNPSLGTEQLERYHFETLLLCERAKNEVIHLAKQERDMRRKKGKGLEKYYVEEEGSSLDSLEKRIEQLRSFIARVEESQAQ
jgi:hypothetical protein